MASEIKQLRKDINDMKIKTSQPAPKTENQKPSAIGIATSVVHGTISKQIVLKIMRKNISTVTNGGNGKINKKTTQTEKIVRHGIHSRV